MQGHLIFVYGTLMKGFGNHGFLTGSDFLGDFETQEKYQLSADGIPFVSRQRELSTIKGELYAVDDGTLFQLDALEGHPNWYKRELINVISEDGFIVQAWIYFNEKNVGRKIINDGDYRYHIRAHRFAVN